MQAMVTFLRKQKLKLGNQQYLLPCGWAGHTSNETEGRGRRDTRRPFREVELEHHLVPLEVEFGI